MSHFFHPFWRKIIALVPLSFSVFTITGESLIFDHLKVEDGLINNVVSGIVQDFHGYLWFGTQDGLCRYDGQDFLPFDSLPFDDNSLAHNEIQTLYLDPADERSLWIGTSGGVSRMNLETREFFNVTAESARTAEPLSNGMVTSIIRDAYGYIWVGTKEGLNRINPLTMAVQSYFHSDSDPDSILHDVINSLELDKKNRLWIGSCGGLDLYDSDSDHFLHYTADSGNPEALRFSCVSDIQKGPGQQLWIGSRGGDVSLFDTEKGIVNSRIPIEEDISLFYTESEDSLWIGTGENGLYHWKIGEEVLFHYAPDGEDQYALNHGSIRSFLKDRSGLYWIGTKGGGVNKVDPRKKDFRYFSSLRKNYPLLPKDRVLSILNDSKGDVWIGTARSGLWRVSGDNENPVMDHWMPEGTPASLSSEGIHAFLEDSKGTLWVGSSGGMDRFNEETGDFTPIFLRPIGTDSALKPIVSAIAEDRDGTLWIGTENSGLIHWSEEEGILEIVPFGHQVNAIYLDSEDTLWVGTSRGLNRLNRQTGGFEAFYHDIRDKRTLSNNNISAILEDSLKNLWIGTIGGGVNLFDQKKGTFHAFTRQDGLLSNNIESFLEDDRNRLWIATINGINILNVQTSEILTMDSCDGIMASEMSRGAAKGETGRLYFGYKEGLLRIEPMILHDNYIPPLLWFNDVQVMGRSIEFQEYLKEDKLLALPWNKSFLAFEFAALDFVSPHHNLYRYKMEGLDRDWVNSGNRNYASYSNLKPGRYTFSVQGSNNDGFWNTKSLEFFFRVKPPPWRQKWFIILHVSLFILFFFLLSNLEATFLLKKKLRNMEMSHANLQILNSQLETQAWRDALTGLANRRYFDLSVHNLWSLAARERKNLAILMIDVDFFKSYNDSYGHQMGDEALRKTAGLIRNMARRNTDTVCRYGGEEFSVLMYDTPLDKAAVLCESLLDQFKQAHIPHEGSSAAPYLTISIGLAVMVPHSEETPESLIHAADKALYAAKGKGRNRVECDLFITETKDNNE